MKIIGVLLAMVCVAVVVTEATVVAMLYQRGVLTPHNIHEIQLVLAGQPPTDVSTPAESAESRGPSLDDVVKQRAMRMLDLQTRENELNLLKNTTVELAKDLISKRQAFDDIQRKFREELAEANASAASAAADQSRSILAALPPEDAVVRLMGLSLPESVELLKGMPEKTIAKILKEFRGAPDRVERGQQIFEALSRGEPAKSIVDEATQALNTTPRAATP